MSKQVYNVLDEKGLQHYNGIVADAINSKESTAKVGVNFLKNWYLANPFNLHISRNMKDRISKSSYTATADSSKIAVNCWWITNATATVYSPNFLRLSSNDGNEANMNQIVDMVAPVKSVTLSVLLSDTSTCTDTKVTLRVNCLNNENKDNPWKSVEASVTGKSGLLTCTANLVSVIEEGYMPCDYTVFITVKGSDKYADIIAAKLEIGDVSTLGSKENNRWFINDNPPTEFENIVLENLDNVG